MPRKDKKFWSVVIGPEEHQRVKVMAAYEKTTVSDLVKGLINRAWTDFKPITTTSKETDNGKDHRRQA